MRLFLVREGTQARALRSGPAMVEVDEVTLKADATYELEDLTIDPLGVVANLPAHVIGGAYQRAGWYGFRLPRNARGYTTLLVPGDAVAIL